MKGFSRKKTKTVTEARSEEKKADPKTLLQAVDLVDSKVSSMNKRAERILELVGKIH